MVYSWLPFFYTQANGSSVAIIWVLTHVIQLWDCQGEPPRTIISSSWAINLVRLKQARKITVSVVTLHRCLELLSVSSLPPMFTLTIRPIFIIHGPTQLVTSERESRWIRNSSLARRHNQTVTLSPPFIVHELLLRTPLYHQRYSGVV